MLCARPCTLLKWRNVAAYLPKELAGRIDRRLTRLARAFNQHRPGDGLACARSIAAGLEADHPDAAASLRDGLADMFTVRRLGVIGRLAQEPGHHQRDRVMISVAGRR